MKLLIKPQKVLIKTVTRLQFLSIIKGKINWLSDQSDLIFNFFKFYCLFFDRSIDWLVVVICTENENIKYHRLSEYDPSLSLNELGATVTYDVSTFKAAGWKPSLVTDQQVVVCQYRMYPSCCYVALNFEKYQFICVKNVRANHLTLCNWYSQLAHFMWPHLSRSSNLTNIY